MNTEEHAQFTEVQNYEPLIEELSNWQALFETALDEAARLLTAEQFPAEALQASLAEMCALLRDVLQTRMMTGDDA
uniref:Uncharacterized protein n=1 Tax=Thermosporothrix sp. COM3 TaxID=2490863 RepID=A0A455SGH1_9CHLR|nr:hypothetical protein KTC_22980 [Thermosporothrix sp. COM3]